MKKAIVTIASNNYFAQVKVLMKSMEISNPEWDRYFILVDEKNDDIWNENNNFEKLSFKDVGIEDIQKMSFYYDVVELNTAVKPFAIDYLFNTLDYDQVIYLDPDIYVYKKLDKIEEEFSKGMSIILTPHFIDELNDDGFLPDEQSVLATGIFNLGFIAFQKSETSMKAIDWWMKKCRKKCVSEIEEGVYVDQKWINYFPSRYEGVYILKDYGYNVAYWNIWERHIEKKSDGEFYVNNYPLVFFHYSGINWNSDGNLFKYTERKLNEYYNTTKELVDNYKKDMIDAGHEKYKCVMYGYNRFSDGRYIEQSFRRYYRKHEELETECGDNPFDKSYLFYGESCYLMHYYEWHEREQRRKKLDLIKNAKSIVIFGKGHNGKRLYEILSDKGLQESVVCFCDNKVDSSIDYLEIISPEEAAQKYANALFLVTPEGKEVEIIGQLLNHGLKADNIMIFGIKEIHEVLLEND